MALSLLAKPSPTRALLIGRLRQTPTSSMRALSLPLKFAELSSSAIHLKASAFVERRDVSLCQRGWILLPGSHAKHRFFCSSSGFQQPPGSNTSNAGHGFQGQQSANSHAGQQQQISAQRPQQPGYPSRSIPSNASQQPPQGIPAPATRSTQQFNAASASPTPSANSAGGAPSPPRTSAAAEVIDKYLGPSTLKLEKRDDKTPPPPPPPPRRNYGPQGTQEKKSGKDLVAESAACAVIEKYLGPWPGFPPRDPKIDEYLDSLPENAACAAIDKYFGPYKPLFVFKKNEENANNPPPPSRPPRSRMMNRARNRQWNASQQGASVDRPWTAPQQQGPSANVGHAPSTAGGVPSSQAAAPPSSPPQSSPQHGTGGTLSQSGHTASPAGAVPTPQGGSPAPSAQMPPLPGGAGNQ